LSISLQISTSFSGRAQTLYKMLGKKFKFFDNAKPKTTYRNIVEGSAKIEINHDKIKVEFGKKAFNPMVMDWVKSLPEMKVPWMQNKAIQYSFE
jgi:hypothetical protein